MCASQTNMRSVGEYLGFLAGVEKTTYLERTMSEKITKQALVEIAKQLELKNVQKLSKADLIHRIQIAEGNSDCFGRIPDCTVEPCLFRSECIGN